MRTQKNLLKRLAGILMAVCCLLGMIPAQTAFATESYHTITTDSGWGYATTTATVWYESTGNTVYGSVSAGEGFTIISKANNRYCINYSISTSPGWKEGWIDAAYVDTQYMNRTKAGIINSSSTTYYYHGTNSVQAGSVSTNERVSVLGYYSNSNSYYYLIEYNTYSGRKCAWVPQSKVNIQSSGGSLGYRFMDTSSNTPDYCENHTGHSLTVYKSPYVSSANGAIYDGDVYYAGGGELINGVYFVYVEYHVDANTWKCGFIIP